MDAALCITWIPRETQTLAGKTEISGKCFNQMSGPGDGVLEVRRAINFSMS